MVMVMGMVMAWPAAYTARRPPTRAHHSRLHLMPYDQDAFISYAHIDNEPITAGQKGWVTQFHATLQTMLSQRLGERARIWRDDKLDGDDVFADAIVEQFTKTAVLVSILSPRYLRSEWCTRELREFCAAVERSGKIGGSHKSRVFKVVKTPVDAALTLPDVMQATLGYDFWADEDGAPKELDPAFGDQARQEFLSRISRLAWSLAQSLQQLRSEDSTGGVAPITAPAAAIAPGSTAVPATAKPAVYLAYCGRDLNEVREQLATELRVHGHRVLPDEPLPMTEDALVPMVQELLARCAVAVHLVGRSVGPVPDGPSGRSLAMVQNDCAAQSCERSSLRRIIWLPAGVSGERAEQQAFIEALLRDPAQQRGADLLRGDVEALKATLHRALLPAQPAPPAPSALGQHRVVAGGRRGQHRAGGDVFGHGLASGDAPRGRLAGLATTGLQQRTHRQSRTATRDQTRRAGQARCVRAVRRPRPAERGRHLAPAPSRSRLVGAQVRAGAIVARHCANSLHPRHRRRASTRPFRPVQTLGLGRGAARIREEQRRHVVHQPVRGLAGPAQSSRVGPPFEGHRFAGQG